MNTESIVIEKTYDAPIAAVWDAITDVDKLNQWFFKLEAFEPKVGFAFNFSGNDNGTIVTHECVVKEIIEGKKVTYSFIYKDYPQESFVEWELFPEGEQTRLVLTHSNLAEIAKGSPMFAREKFNGGWTYLTNKLGEYLTQ